MTKSDVNSRAIAEMPRWSADELKEMINLGYITGHLSEGNIGEVIEVMKLGSMIEGLLEQRYRNVQEMNLLRTLISHNRFDYVQLNTSRIVGGIYKLAREGEVNVLQRLALGMELGKVPTSAKYKIFQSTLDSCFGKKVNLDDIKHEFQADKPVVVVQNFCDTIVQLESGKRVKIPSYESTDVLEYLIQHKYLAGDYQYEGHYNKMIVYLNPGHAFFGFSSSDFRAVRGFYPGPNGANLDDNSTEATVDGVLLAMSCAIIALTGANFVGLLLASTIMSLPYVLTDAIIPHIDHQMGDIRNEVIVGELQKSEINNDLKASILLNDQQFYSAIKYLNTVQEDCYKKNFDGCTYHLLSRNCATFVSDLCERATGYAHNALLLFSKEQVSQWRSGSFEAVYNTKVLFFADLNHAFDTIIQWYDDYKTSYYEAYMDYDDVVGDPIW
ncbi:hypothetical protein EDM53_05655 [Rickettsiales endosymbiont of Peranema trichophorum]|uniref:hypothetical protein n=1 Tax=Rickettsiales endosymbiont of Peranema trichophorum TaxID=2486577 RepID=UPI0010231B31|nr:hypothetical protein [Rickettsiales endosymbiont of Peranema trichophorum]RZI45227.1 hypothetical protein EDM53_05655 [Rickettsiales endosymbiont of Peranema trichophorum]